MRRGTILRGKLSLWGNRCCFGLFVRIHHEIKNKMTKSGNQTNYHIKN